MQNLTRAHRELFRRSPDECFESFDSLHQHCQRQKEQCTDRWHLPQEVRSLADDGSLRIGLGDDGDYRLNDWSFTQLCSLARVGKDTVNRLSPETATQVFRETLPAGNKPLQFLTTPETVRSIHGVSYTRLWNADLLDVIREYADDFRPPQKAYTGGTGLYAGEQDLFCFMIDPAGRIEIDGESFAPGFYIWNSEVGRRSVGISSFWFQSVCANHIIWDACDIVEWSRKHTANVHEALNAVRMTLERLIQRRDERRDGFAKVMEKAMHTALGQDADEVQKVLSKSGINRTLARKALQTVQEKHGFTVFSLVDALTRIAASETRYAGERLDVDQKASALLNLVAA